MDASLEEQLCLRGIPERVVRFRALKILDSVNVGPLITGMSFKSLQRPSGSDSNSS